MFPKIVTSDKLPFFVTENEISKIGLFSSLCHDLGENSGDVNLMLSSQYFRLILKTVNGECDITNLSNGDLHKLYEAADYLLMDGLCIKLASVYSERLQGAMVNEITEMLGDF